MSKIKFIFQSSENVEDCMVDSFTTTIRPDIEDQIIECLTILSEKTFIDEIRINAWRCIDIDPHVIVAPDFCTEVMDLVITEYGASIYFINKYDYNCRVCFFSDFNNFNPQA